MPQELLKLIKALETYRAERSPEKTVPDTLSVSEFIEMMEQLLNSDEPPVPADPPKFNQHQGSYKILSLDGTLTAMDIAATDLVQVTKDSVSLVWPHTSIDFTTIPGKGRASISQEEFLRLAEFVSQ